MLVAELYKLGPLCVNKAIFNLERTEVALVRPSFYNTELFLLEQKRLCDYKSLFHIAPTEFFVLAL